MCSWLAFPPTPEHQAHISHDVGVPLLALKEHRPHLLTPFCMAQCSLASYKDTLVYSFARVLSAPPITDSIVFFILPLLDSGSTK